MKLRNMIALAAFVVVMTGCAAGNQYDYKSSTVSLPLSGAGEVGVAVIDNRPYVLDGDKSPDYVGKQRGGFGNPFDVRTASGGALTQDMSASLQDALRRSGYDVKAMQIASNDPDAIKAAAAATGVAKNLVLTVTEWQTDIYMSITLKFDLLLEVITQSGDTIASNSMQGEEVVGGGGMPSQNARTATSAFETKIGRLFNHPDVLEALRN